MMKQRVVWMLAAMAGFGLISQPAMADNSEESGSQEVRQSRAVWVQPAEVQASWLDTRPNVFNPSEMQVIATGSRHALVKTANGDIVAVDKEMHILGHVALPEETTWVGLDGLNRLIFTDGKNLYDASVWEEKLAAQSYMLMRYIDNPRWIDVGGKVIAFDENHHLVLTDLDSGATQQTRLADFLDDEKVASMTPEAVARAEAAAKKRKNSKKSAKEEPAAEESVVPTEMTGLWIRPDDTVVVRVRRMMAERTFVSTDMGRSWTQLENAPQKLIREGGWIWDGTSKVLSKDGLHFVEVTGKELNILDRISLSRKRSLAEKLPENWLNQESPEMTEDGSPVEVSSLIHFKAGESSDISVNRHPHYQPEYPETGTIFGLYRNAQCPDGGALCDTMLQQAPGAWMYTPDGVWSDIDLPEGCLPVYMGNAQGMGVVLCEPDESIPGELLVFVRTENSDWVPEATIPYALSEDTEILSAPDGTLAIQGKCETIVAQETSDTGEVTEVSRNICPVAVRMPAELGQSGIWRIENLSDRSKFALEKSGRLLEVQPSSDGGSQLILRESENSEVLVHNFDDSIYPGVVLTDSGCVALMDGTHDEAQLRHGDQVRLLSVTGGLATLDCAASQEAALKEQEPPEPEENTTGSDRYGLRLGGGAFFAQNNVKTWQMRAEAILPIYGGRYEVGVMYRMSGGNKRNAMGHLGIVSVRWRYDGLELFDFAVGAGIGFGAMCGYKKETQKQSETEETQTEQTTEKKNGYKDCGNASMRYLISGIAAYRLSKQWKIYIAAELMGGTHWGFDVGGGIEIRF